MTTPSTPRKAGPLLGNGSQTTWPFTFKVFAEGDIAVTIANNLGVETALVLNTDYSVALNANQETSPGGTVTYPISGSPLPTGSVLSIVGDLDYDQPLDLPSGGNFSPVALENQLDRTVMQIQQLNEQVARSVKAPVSDAGVDMTMPVAAERANRYLSFDLTGRPVATTFDIDAIQNASTSAIAAAAAAAGSESAAALSESIASQAAATVASTVASVTPTVVRFSGDGVETDFTLPATPGAEENTLVFISGVYQQKDQYSVTGTTLAFTSAPPLGTDNIEVQIGPAIQLSVASALTTSYQPAGTSAVTTTVQAKLRETVSVDDFGAVGDGVTDDSAKIQAAIDYLTSVYASTGRPQTLRFTDGKTYVMRLVYMEPGVNYYAERGATLLKTPAGSETDENVLKNWRMLTTRTASFSTDAACDHRIVISGLTFDGNLANMNWTNNTYNQEQAHCLFVCGSATPATAETRAKFLVKDCHFRNSVADGLSQYYNSDLIAESITADNCFRGGFVSTGGNSRLVLRGYVGENARLDFEVDGAGFGGSYASDVDVDGVIVDQYGGGLRPGGVDLGSYVLPNTSIFRARNVFSYTGPTNLAATGDVFELFNCYFTTGEYSPSKHRLLRAANRTLIEKCHFHIVDDNPAATQYAGIQAQIESASPAGLFQNKKVTFKNCSFSADAALAGKEVYGVLSPSNIFSYSNLYEFIDCHVPSNFTAAVYFIQGGRMRWRGGFVDSASAWFADYSGTTRYVALEIDSPVLGPNCTKFLGTNIAASATGSTLTYKNVVINSTQAGITTRAGAATGIFDIINGGRTIMGTTVPPSVNAYRGDLYRLQEVEAGKPWEWVATNTTYSATGTWVPTRYATARNTTANRPSLTASDTGTLFLDTTLDADGKPIWWNGTAWVDATGATV